jgi:hypothetical protein
MHSCQSFAFAAMKLSAAISDHNASSCFMQRSRLKPGGPLSFGVVNSFIQDHIEQIGLTQIGSTQIGFVQIYSKQPGFAKDRAAQIRFAEVGRT